MPNWRSARGNFDVIGLGAAPVTQFKLGARVFGAFLAATGIKMLAMIGHKPKIADTAALKFARRRMNITPELHGERVFIRKRDPATAKPTWFATPLFGSASD